MKLKRAGPKKCDDCGKLIPNKDYMKHRAEEHNDPQAKAILEELRDL